MSGIVSKIKARLVRYKTDQGVRLNAEYTDNQSRLRTLVEQHGLDVVALASELTTKTLKQYIVLSRPPAISKETVDKAESILKGL